MASTEDFTADDVFDMLVESSNVVKVAYTETADGQLITGDRIEIIKDAGERNARVNDLLEREELVRQQSARSGLVHTPVDAAPPLVSDAVSNAQLFELARRLQEGVRDGDVRTVRLYKNAVVAKHVVDWLTTHAPKIVGGTKTGAPTSPCKRPIAVALAQRMLDAGWLVPAEDAKVTVPFADDGTVYRYLLRVLQDDGCSAAVAERLHAALWAPSGGIPTHTEKIMLKTVHKVVKDADLNGWLPANVPGATPAATSAIVKVLLKQGVLEPVRVIGTVATPGVYVLAPQKNTLQ